MRVIIAGGHGNIARILERMLTQRGDSVAGIIRNPAHSADLEQDGVEPVLLDMEAASAEDVAAHLDGVDAVVFAAGAGPGSGAIRKETVDRAAAVLLADAAEAAGVRRYVMISAIGADAEAPDEAGNPVFVAYLRAKGAADDDVRSRDGLDATIVRPGLLTDDPGTGTVTVAEETGHGRIPREDVAAVLLAVLDTPGTAGRTFEVVSGDTPIHEAVERIADRR
ncbi:NAD(P)H-binding protein [Mycolicibacterium holsaticum]|uniref:NAD(P)H-binding protein n=1 Tax=Mycolicibacterium holsaticum TaxID=152142 RepID=UPI001C7CFA17|nr:NAD(P)H-binding protein [Mycolicibacterium holsaticum]MDA4106239.1 NAD-dependent dehydratase [Mycolicibacterium holsaticum DSM 44478 = JCM 12374]QZA13445.1 NAD(P)H-binding protein [Mycolicibacterium holsaticum DSM 44478 = JCM 12374]UNC09090.1 NAD(P)H-binding protein [Mycolicibacterium holsaticum DSM 44478 = JCM 12374]